MKHFIDPAGRVYAFEPDGSQDHLIQEDWVVLSDEELDAIRHPEPTPNDYAKLRDRQLNAIDQAAGAARARFASPGALIDEEYRQALEAVKAWRAAGNPAGDVPPEIQSGADYSGITVEAAAVEIEQTAEQWDSVIAQIRSLRLAGKAAVKAAADDDIETTAQGYLDQLAGIKPAEA